jgi:hypothetical protein
MECHKCPDYMKHQGEAWETTPCAKCQLTHDSYGTFEYQEGNRANSSEDNPDDEYWTPEVADDQSPQPYAVLDGEDPDDPRIPLSSLVSAVSLILNEPSVSRRILQLRMKNVPYSKIGARLGFSRQAAEKLLAQALARQPLLQNLLPGKRARGITPLTATHDPAIAEHDSGSQKRITPLHKPRFQPHCATRDSA